MALALPSASVFKIRFPAFAAVNDDLVALVLAEARAWVDETWITADQQPAVMLYAAHVLTSESYGNGATGLAGSAPVEVSGPVTSIQVGDVKTTFAKPEGSGSTNSNSSGDGFAATDYGKRFLQLLRRNSPSVAVLT